MTGMPIELISPVSTTEGEDAVSSPATDTAMPMAANKPSAPAATKPAVRWRGRLPEEWLSGECGVMVAFRWVAR